MNRCRFRQAIFKNHAHAIALIDLDRWTRATAVVTPGVDGLEWRDFSFHDFARQSEHFDVAVELEGQIGDIRSNDARPR